MLWVLARNSGPVSQLDSINLLGFTPRVARSAGLHSLSMYLHWSGDDKLRISWTLLANVEMLAFIGNVAENYLRIGVIDNLNNFNVNFFQYPLYCLD